MDTARAAVRLWRVPTYEQDPQVGRLVHGVDPGVELEEGDHHQDQAVGRQPAREHLQGELERLLHCVVSEKM